MEWNSWDFISGISLNPLFTLSCWIPDIRVWLAIDNLSANWIRDTKILENLHHHLTLSAFWDKAHSMLLYDFLVVICENKSKVVKQSKFEEQSKLLVCVKIMQMKYYFPRILSTFPLIHLYFPHSPDHSRPTTRNPPSWTACRIKVAHCNLLT